MDAGRLEAYRRSLLEKRHEILSRVSAIRTAEATSGGRRAADFVDRATDAGSRDLLYRLSSKERTTLRRIDAALARIEAGVYGICAHCGETVEERRLEAVPWALHCIECQELQDQGII